MQYFSQRALNEIDDAHHTRSTTTNVSAAKGVGASKTTQISLDEPASTDKVDFALKRAKKVRRIRKKIHRISNHGNVFDIETSDVKLGAMPFTQFGLRGEQMPEKVRAFWAQSFVRPPRWRNALGTCELSLLGPLDNMVNNSWADKEDQIQISHFHPSDPSVLYMLLQQELSLADEATEEHAKSIQKYEIFEEGCYARFASEETARASKPKGRPLSSVSYALTWERRPALRKARIVGIVHDVADGIVLARPVLVQEMS